MKSYIKRNFFIIILILIILCTFFISNFILQFSLVSGHSMEPTYKNFEFTLINRLSALPERYDVYAIKKNKIGTIIKRVYGLPGDTVIIHNNMLYINNSPVFTFDDDTPKGDTIYENELVLNTGEYFVMGDNVNKSKDSRFSEIGIIYAKEFIGKIIPAKPFIAK